MRKFRFVFLALALILVAGMTTGLIVRKQTGGQSVMQHSAQSSVEITPSTTGDDEPAAPEVEVFKITVLIKESFSQYFTVIENGVEVDPIDVFEYSDPSLEEQSKGDPEEDESYSATYVRYLVDPTCSSIAYEHNLRPGGSWFAFEGFIIDFTEPSCNTYYCYAESSSSGSIVLSEFLFLVIR